MRTKNLKTYKTNAICPRCGKHLMTTDILGYAFTCYECDENFYTIEVKQVASDMLEIAVPLSISDFMLYESKLLAIAIECDCDFFGYDDVCYRVDYGWNIESSLDSEKLSLFTEKINKLFY